MSETIIFQGTKYHRYPESKYPANRKYFRTQSKFLHREVWIFYKGDIPTGYEVHHTDKDTTNNDIGNLELVESVEHVKKFHPLSEGDRKKKRSHIERIRPLASEWHGSPEGKEWHSQSSKKMWEKREAVEYNCLWCDKPFFTRDVLADKPKYCSNKCKAAYRRSLGVDNEIRICAECNQPFTTNKYKKAKTCSPKCTQSARRKNDSL